jgi:hypothetical protein
MDIGPAARVRPGEKTCESVGDCRHATVACGRLGSSAVARSTTPRGSGSAGRRGDGRSVAWIGGSQRVAPAFPSMHERRGRGPPGPGHRRHRAGQAPPSSRHHRVGAHVPDRHDGRADGAVYVSEQGFGFPAGAGRILRHRALIHATPPGRHASGSSVPFACHGRLRRSPAQRATAPEALVSGRARSPTDVALRRTRRPTRDSCFHAPEQRSR